MSNEQQLIKRMGELERQVDNLQKNAFQETGAGGREYDSDVLDEISQIRNEIQNIDEQLYNMVLNK